MSLASNNNSGVYLLKVGELCYVGSSVDLRRRQREHTNNLKKNKHSNPILQNAYNKYQTLCCEVLQEVEPDVGILVKVEQEWYDRLKPSNKMANCCDFVATPALALKGRKIPRRNPEEWKRKLSLTNSDGRLAGKNNPRYGVPITEKQKAAFEEANKNRVFSEDRKAKLSVRAKAYRATEETREKQRLLRVGIKKPIEHVVKAVAARKNTGKPYWEKGDFIAYDRDGNEVTRCSSTVELKERGFSINPVYRSVKHGTTYQDLFWKKEARPSVEKPAKIKKTREEITHNMILARTKDGRAYNTKGDFVAYDADGKEVARCSCVKELEKSGYANVSVYQSINTGKPSKGLFWKKEIYHYGKPAKLAY